MRVGGDVKLKSSCTHEEHSEEEGYVISFHKIIIINRPVIRCIYFSPPLLSEFLVEKKPHYGFIKGRASSTIEISQNEYLFRKNLHHYPKHKFIGKNISFLHYLQTSQKSSLTSVAPLKLLIINKFNHRFLFYLSLFVIFSNPLSNLNLYFFPFSYILYQDGPFLLVLVEILFLFQSSFYKVDNINFSQIVPTRTFSISPLLPLCKDKFQLKEPF